jgi:hypothetical protein
LNALGRLLAVGSEWGSYVAPIGGAAGRGLAREVAEEASEQLGRHSVRQASRELKPVVIGKNMERVEAYARMIGAETINDWLAGRKWSLELNAVWVQEMKEQGRRVIDIGPHFERRWRFIKGLEKGQPPSDVYALERRLLKGYPLYKKHFIRGGRYGGGVPGLSIGEDWATEPFFP